MDTGQGDGASEQVTNEPFDAFEQEQDLVSEELLCGVGVEVRIGFDIPIMIAVAVACLPVFFTDHLIARWEGVLFLFYYGAYTAYLILAAAQHQALQGFNVLMVYFVMPITALTLVILAVRAFRSEAVE